MQNSTLVGINVYHAEFYKNSHTAVPAVYHFLFGKYVFLHDPIEFYLYEIKILEPKVFLLS